jgi:aryl-alcohol dehydrogenase-like predicted oxidoreductase
MTPRGIGAAGRIGLGTAPLAFKDVTAQQAIATIHTALDHGVRLIDTAAAYTRAGIDAYAETVVAKALARRSDRADVLVATKGGHRRAGDDFPVDASPAALRADCDRSLQALGVDQIGLYQLHHVDPRVPLADSVGALLELRSAGKIAEIGLSNVSIAQIDRARELAPIGSVQNRLSLADPADLPTARHCADLGIAYLAYQPLGGSGARPVDVNVAAVADRHGVSAEQVWLAWLLAQGRHIVALAGSSRPATIAQSARAADVTLSTAELALLGR